MSELNDDGLKQLFTDLISGEFYFKEDDLLTILRNRGCSDKYKLVMWMASYLHPEHPIKGLYFESQKEILEKLDIKIDNANKALKQIEEEGIFYREGHQGQRMRKWIIGDKKNHVEPVKSKDI